MSRVHEALVKAIPHVQAPDTDASVGPADGDEENPKRGLGYRSRSARARGFAAPEGERPKSGERQAWADLPAPLRAEIIKLVQRVFVFPNSHAPRTIVFSSVEGRGSSEVCFRVAEVLAGQGSASVCLVSTSSPVLKDDIEEASKCRGWTGAMTSSDPITEFVLPTIAHNLWVIPPGSNDEAHLFPSDTLRSRITELKKKFDYLLIDAPAITASPNAVVLGQMADGVILVVEANCTRHDTARIAKETLHGAKVRVLGAILNNHTLPGV